jgi:CheY-like chemotaxis protein
VALNILLADDDHDDRFFFSNALKEISVESHLTMVHDGAALMVYLSKNLLCLPDVLFLDLSMPQKSGIECLVEIRNSPELKDLPVIMFSTSFPRDKGYEQSLIKMLMSLGANDFIRKPNSLAELKYLLNSCLDKFVDK